ncbi:hypothetical protein [Devosia chinhatensis]|uniref:Lipoprotein n=1 Tax=Devosia chinhatensis TaxID=429727 RepID=A0A0F5FHC3_9HYPH|nr:hypothetical protein [Devosia chinhatensis]KKB07985.1 hypothetical protein VE26_15420 [Devosia chinhatensis]
MRLMGLGKTIAVGLLGLALSGCVDVDIDVALTSATTARATMTQTMSADVYAMVKMDAESAETSEPGFCDEGDLVENADGSATCTMTEQGAFADLDLGQSEGGISFTAAGPGLVRLALPTAELNAGLDLDSDMDEQTRQMAMAFFEGHSISVTFSGLEIVDTNMTRSADGLSASQAIPMTGLIEGTLALPDELFAIVRAP